MKVPTIKTDAAAILRHMLKFLVEWVPVVCQCVIAKALYGTIGTSQPLEAGTLP